MKSNRIINPFGFKVKLSQFANSINPNTLDVVIVKDKSYRVYRYEGPVGSFENTVILICYEINGQDLESPVYLLSTDIDLDTHKIIEYYFVR